MGTQTTGTQPSPGRMMFGNLFKGFGTMLTQGPSSVPDIWKQFRESVGGMRSQRGPVNG